MHIHTQQNKMFFCEVLATHQNQDDKFETNISILAGDCHIVATSNSCRVSVLYKHSSFVLLSHFRAGIPYEDFRKQMLLMARALPPAAGHHEVSGQTGLSPLPRRGHAEGGGAPCRSCRGAGQAGLGHQHRPAQVGGGEGCPAWNQGSQVLASTFGKAWWPFQGENKKGIPTLQSKQDLGLPDSESGTGGRNNAFAIEFSYIRSLLERAWFEGQAALSRPVFLQSWPLITAAAMQTGCLYGCICLFHSCVPALNPAFACRSAVTAQRWQ